MSKKEGSKMYIKQVLSLSFILVSAVFFGVKMYNSSISQSDMNYAKEENNSEIEFVAEIVENTEEDYITYVNDEYLGKKEIFNLISRGSKIDRFEKLLNIQKESVEEEVEIIEEQPVYEQQEIIEEVVEVTEEEPEKDTPPTEYKRVLEVKATAYCLCQKCCGKAPGAPGYGVTASGLKIIPNTGMKVIAVDPKVVPLGSKVYVEGLNGVEDYGYAIAADTGGAIKNMKIDLYMDSHASTNIWGVKNVRLYVIE